MTPDDAKALAQEFDRSGAIDFRERQFAAGIGPGCFLIVRMPGQPDRVGEAARRFLRRLVPHLTLLQDRALDAVNKLGYASPQEIVAGERIALAQLEKEGG